MMCQCRLIPGKKCFILVNTLIMGEAIPVWGWGVHGKSLYLPPNFLINLKLCQKVFKVTYTKGRLGEVEAPVANLAWRL